MEKASDLKQDASRLLKNRVVGKLFGRDKKTGKKDEDDGDDVSNFLHGPSDKLYMTGTLPVAPPKLAKLDTSSSNRWPTADEVRHTRDNSRGRSASPKRNRKGLLVRFTDRQPEIIGHGGDETEEPPCQISAARRRAYSHPPMTQQQLQAQSLPATQRGQDADYAGRKSESDTFRPQPIRRTQTGHVPTPELTGERQAVSAEDRDISQPQSISGDDHQQEGTLPMRNTSNPTPYGAQDTTDSKPSNAYASPQKANSNYPDITGRGSLDSVYSDSASNTSSHSAISQPLYQASLPYREFADGSPYQLGERSSSERNRGSSPIMAIRARSNNHDISNQTYRPGNLDRVESSAGRSDTVGLSDDDALEDFGARVRQLFKLFKLSAESVVPLSKSSLEDMTRAASWWFLKGRAKIEQSAQGRPSSAEGQMQQDLFRQQGHADLAKSFWIVCHALPYCSEMGTSTSSDLDSLVVSARAKGRQSVADAFERCQAIRASLRKLAISMKRNNLLPPNPDEAPLSAGIDHGIWVAYPSSTPDISALLSGHTSLVAAPRGNWLEALPLGDTTQFFNYGRMFVSMYLTEGRLDAQDFFCPCILSICRKRGEQNIMIMLASQNDLVSLCIQADKSKSPNWKDVRWQTEIFTLDIQLSRGFVARIQCSPSDYKTLWGMYDYTSRTHANLYPRKHEAVLFDGSAKTFQYFGNDARTNFPRDPVPDCHVRIFEKALTENVGAGTRRRHCGFRIAVVTSVNTKRLSGISHEFLPQIPIRYSFVRVEGNLQALLLACGDGPTQTTMVLGFNDVQKRSKFHECLTGWPETTEVVRAYLTLEDFRVESFEDKQNLRKMALRSSEKQEIRVIQETFKDIPALGNPKQPLLPHMRLLISSRENVINDRINTGSGELKICLATRIDTHTLAVLRRPQEDMTVGIAESPRMNEISREMTKVLHTIADKETARTYYFSKLEDLHSFQTAITGFDVLFDGIATSFAISRRRMVVPIYKKWEAPVARLQILQREKVLQFAAFFDGFSHGECMNFVLKVTDAYESFGKGGSFSVRLVDAKFAIPKGGADDEKYESIDKSFVSLEEPDYPAEHDDITITFASEAERDRFAEALPAQVKAVSRLGTVRR